MAAAEPKLLSSDIEHLTEKQVRGLVRGQAGKGPGRLRARQVRGQAGEGPGRSLAGVLLGKLGPGI